MKTETVEQYLARGGIITKCPQAYPDPASRWIKDFARHDVLNRMGNVVPDGMVPFSRKPGKGA
jgi:hypothetical protein